MWNLIFKIFIIHVHETTHSEICIKIFLFMYKTQLRYISRYSMK